MPAQYLPELVAWVKEAADMALAAKADLAHELKKDGSIVTKADRAIERFFRDRLPDLIPGTTVWGEEEGYTEPGPNGLWALDPIDGTSNYRYGSPHWGVSVGYIRDGQAQLGVIAMPDMGKIYAAAKGVGAAMNGKALPPIRPGIIERTELVSYGDLTVERYGKKDLPGKHRYLGAFVADSTMFLDGIFRAMLSDKASLYDAAATICIANELGADVRYADGEALDLNALLNVQPFPKAVAFLPRDSGFYL